VGRVLGSFVVIEDGVAGLVAELVFFGLGQVVSGHFFDLGVESDFRGPAKVPAGFGRVSEQGVHFRGAEIPGVYGPSRVLYSSDVEAW